MHKNNFNSVYVEEKIVEDFEWRDVNPTPKRFILKFSPKFDLQETLEQNLDLNPTLKRLRKGIGNDFDERNRAGVKYWSSATAEL